MNLSRNLLVGVALTGLLLGGVAGIWWWGLQTVALMLAVSAAGATAIAALWGRWASSRRLPVRTLTLTFNLLADIPWCSSW